MGNRKPEVPHAPNDLLVVLGEVQPQAQPCTAIPQLTHHASRLGLTDTEVSFHRDALFLVVPPLLHGHDRDQVDRPGVGPGFVSIAHQQDF